MFKYIFVSLLHYILNYYIFKIIIIPQSFNKQAILSKKTNKYLLYMPVMGLWVNSSGKKGVCISCVVKFPHTCNERVSAKKTEPDIRNKERGRKLLDRS